MNLEKLCIKGFLTTYEDGFGQNALELKRISTTIAKTITNS